MKKTAKGYLILSLLSAIIMAGGVTSLSADDSISAYDLWKFFKDNPVAAKENYVDNKITVEGIVISAKMSIYFTPAIELSDQEDGEKYVVCVLPRSDMGKLSDFQKGDKVKLQGNYYRTNDNSGTIVVKQCRRVD